MLEAIDVNQRVEFISKFDTNEPKTIFVLKPLSGLEMLEISGGTHEDIKKMIVKSVVEIKNYGKDAPINELINSISLNVLGELLNKINALNNLVGQDAKN